MVISENIPSKLEIIPGFITNFFAKIKGINIAHDDIFNLKLSLEEALVNAVRHGNKLNPDLEVKIQAEVENNHVTISVKDQGKGFDFANLQDPTRNTNLAKPSGRGVFLILKLMDKVEFLNGGSCIRMTKFLNKQIGSTPRA